MKILVTYSSGYGTTREIAEKICQILQEENAFQVDIISIDEVVRINQYETVIVGSSVRAEHPLANVVDFIALHRHELEQKHVALFLVCLGANCEQGRKNIKDGYLPKLMSHFPRINPIAVEAFGGKIDFDKLNPVMQSLMRRVLEKNSLPNEGSVDTRDWDFIDNWAVALRAKLIALASQDSTPITAK